MAADRDRRRATGQAAVLLLVAALTSCGPSCRDLRESVDGFNYVAGTQTALSLYQFSEDTLLVETARGIRNLGSNAIKLSMSARYCTVEYRLPADERIRSLRDLATLEPSFRQVFDMDFRYYLVWTYCFSQYRGGDGQADLVSFTDGFSAEEAKQVYRELHDLARYLLET